MSQATWVSIEGWESKHPDPTLNQKGFDQARYYREEWVNYQARTADIFTSPKIKAFLRSAKQYIKMLKKERKKRAKVIQDGEVIQAKDPREVEGRNNECMSKIG